MKRVYIVGAKRTAIGNFGGSLKNIPAPKLGSAALAAALEQAGVKPEEVSETILGNILSAGQGMGPARQASMAAGIPREVPAYAVNMLCGSGMKALTLGYASLVSGTSAVAATGGMESMSQAPYLVPASSRFGTKLGHLLLQDHLILDGLTDVFNDYHMGVTAENIAREYGISREQQDRFAAHSQKKASGAIRDGKFRDEIVPVEVPGKKGTTIFDTDEYPRADTTEDVLAKLKPAFEKDGTVTAGNASGINDGASAIIIADENSVERLGLRPLAEVVAWGQAGVDPAFMGLGPVPAVRNALATAKIALKDIELIELNEAFAAQSLGVIRDLAREHGVAQEWLLDRTNVNGGAIALGHPLGASGSRIIVTLLYEMMKRRSTYGLASLCAGGGMGIAVVLKRV